MAENVGKRLEQKESKQKKAKKPSRLTKGQKWLLAVAIVLAVVLVAVVALDGLFVKPELPGKGNGSNAPSLTGPRRKTASTTATASSPVSAANGRARITTPC